MAPVPWPAYVSILSGIGSLGLAAYLGRYRGKPGATWFLLSLGFQTVWGVAYGVGLLVFAPDLRWVLEVITWVGMSGTSVYFFAFALAYTGRSTLLGGWWFRGLLVAPVVAAVLVGTNPVHGLTWVDYRLVPLLGMATVDYALRPWTLAGMTSGVLIVLVGSLLLFDTVVSYGPLYRREAVAVGLSTLPPSAALLVWLYGVGPVPELNFATLMFVPHVALDAYAFVGSDMFEFHPATRRAGERAAIDDLGTPVVVVDERGRVVTLNDAACDRFGTDKRRALTAPLADLLGTAVDPAAPGDAVEIRSTDGRRVYAIASTPLMDAGGTHLGYTVIFQDVTGERRREQRVNVLNRVLRHNLRNDMDVIRGYAAAANETVDGDAAAFLDTIEDKADELLALGEKARNVERILDRDGTTTDVSLDALVDRVVADLTDDGPDGPAASPVADDGTGTDPDDAGAAGDVSVDVDGHVVRSDPATLETVLSAIVENALEHGGGAVTVTASRTDGRVTLQVSDDGPGVPDHELAVIDEGAESALEHGSGLGLWLVDWGANTLGGDVTFDVDESGTTVTVTLPAATDHDGRG